VPYRQLPCVGAARWSPRARAASLITPNQCRNARRLLGWSRERLTALCEVTVYFITGVERGKEVPQDKVDAIRAALEAAGVEFIAENGGGPGVRLKSKSP
jgi:transcriptional regulator with XRE-family HTH domain